MSCFFKFLYSFFVFVNGPQALYVNPGCLKFIWGINVSLGNKNLLTISFILYLVLTCLILPKQRGPAEGIWLKGFFIPKVLNNQLASCCLINLDFLLPHTTEALFFRFLSLQLLDFYFLYFFYNSNNIMITLFYQ